MTLLVITLTILFALIACLRLPWAVLLLITLLPSYLLRVEFFGVPTTLLELMILVVILVWLIQNRHRARELFRLEKRWAIMIALFVLSATISAIIAPDTIAALGIWKAYFIEPILLFYLVVDLHRRNKITSEHIIKSLMAGGVMVSLFAIVQWLTGAGIPIPWDFERRVTGVFDYPNALGLYLGPLAVLALSHTSLYQHRELVQAPVPAPGAGTRPDLGLGLFFLFFLAILLAQSEAAIAAIVITLIVMGLLNQKFCRKTIVVVAILAIISLAIPFSRSYLIQKITLQDYSGQVRIGQWAETWELIKDHPVLGVGLSGYPAALVPYHTRTHIEIFQYPHNIFLNIWVELGLLGLIAFGWLIFLLLSASGVWGPRLFLLPASYFLLPLLTLFFHGLVDVPYFKNDLAILTWVLIALFYVQVASPKIQR